jgi:pilus assembly protein CpaE
MSQAIRIVVVGSDATSIEDISRCLNRQSGNAVLDGVAIGFERGAELIHKRQPPVVVLDMCTKGVDHCIRWIESVLSRSPRVSFFAVCEDKSYETIRNFMRAGAVEYLLKPVSEADFASALHKIGRLRALPKPAEAEGGKVYSVFSSKNGIGATTISVNLAASICKITKEPAIIVDLDLIGGDVATFLNLKPAFTISDITRNINRADMSLLRGIIMKHESGVHVLAGPHDVEEGVSISGDAVRKVLGLLKTMYRHIVMDTEANLTQTTMTALHMSDLVLLPFILSLPSITNTHKYLNYLHAHGVKNNKIKLVVNRYFKKSEIKIEEAEKILKQHISWWIPNDFSTAMSCLNKGTPLAAYSPHSKLNLSIRDLAIAVSDMKKGPDKTHTLSKASAFDRVVKNLSLKRQRET